MIRRLIASIASALVLATPVVALTLTGKSIAITGTILAPQQPTCELRLEVFDPSGKRIEAEGTIENLFIGTLTNFMTDANGRFTFAGLPRARYRLLLSRSGFGPYTLLVDIKDERAISRIVTLQLRSLHFGIDVIATTPLSGVDLERDQVAAPVQSANDRQIDQSGALNLADFINRRFGGVHINDVQNNPFQPDVNYRGYTASPLLGTPQGLSVYMDGVRLNQPFGDVVSWDLIPRIAVSEVTLIPGSNPLFGLNTLGGSLSVQTKDGRQDSGTALQISGGSFGRLVTELEHGGSNTKGLTWYLASSLFFEDGWRDDSTSNVRQFFGKTTWQHAGTTLGLTVSFANNSLVGNGLQEQRFLDRSYSSVYTKPDITDNRSPSLNLTVRHGLGANLTFSGNAYYRYIGTNSFNGDINDDSLDQSIYQPSAAERAALAAAGYSGFPISGATAANTPFPFWRCIGQSLLRDEPAEKCNGVINKTRALQRNYGVSGQLTWFGLFNGNRNQLTVGGGYDGNRVGFIQSSQLGYLNPDRSVTGVNSFGDGVTGGEVDGEPYDTRLDLDGRIHTGSIFATDTLALWNSLNLTFSARYNHTSIDNRDRIRTGGVAGSLDGNHTFSGFNPAVGLTFAPWRAINLYASYTVGSRAPTSIELGCADPGQPCKLPNAMAGDPPLAQVTTRTFEAGIRGDMEGRVSWSAGWFRADNRDDILFVSSDQTGFGYFKNFGRTHRQGLEVDVNARVSRFGLNAGYTYLDATFQSPETVDGSGNSTNDEVGDGRGLDGSIAILPGAQIPLIPSHMFKAFADVQATAKLSFNLGVVAFSSAFARGNENNLHQPDGEYYLGAGRSPGYAVVNVGARYQLTRRLQLIAQVNNLFDRKYYTSAQLGPTGFTATGAFIARPFPAVNGEFPLQHVTFYAPGAPLGAWGSIRLTF
ncbi:MAG: TonB-dependent receptor [Acidobacteriota bacterium]